MNTLHIMRFFFHIKTDLHQDQFELLHKFGNDIFGILLQYVFHILSSNVLCFFISVLGFYLHKENHQGIY